MADEGKQASEENPAPNGFETWNAYWAAQGMAWRMEPEIGEKRQRVLAERRAVKPNIEQGTYPFRDENGPIKLTRADVEWLLVTHEHEGVQGPLSSPDMMALALRNWPRGLDLRGADLNGIDLSELPLTRLVAGMPPNEASPLPWFMRREAVARAAVNLDGANLTDAHLEMADLLGAHLDGAVMEKAHLEGAVLTESTLSNAIVPYAHLEGAFLNGAQLDGVFALHAHLEGAQLAGAHIQGARLEYARLEGTQLERAHLEGTKLKEAQLAGTDLRQAHLEGTALNGAYLCGRHMPEADVERIQKWQPNFRADQPPADLRHAVFDATTDLQAARLGDKVHGSVYLADALYNGVNLAVVDWDQVAILGDEREAEKLDRKNRQSTEEGIPLYIWQAAVRANRQVAVVLRSQGLSDHADRFGYKAQQLQTRLIKHQRGKRIEWLFRQTLDKVAGFGYRWERTVYWYVGIALLSTLVYFWQNLVFLPHTPWYQSLGEAVVAAITALHGRGFFPEAAQSGWQMAVAALDAIAGLIIEASFVATFTQRFFAR